MCKKYQGGIFDKKWDETWAWVMYLTPKKSPNISENQSQSDHASESTNYYFKGRENPNLEGYK